MAAENESPAREPGTTRGRGRGGRWRGGRGRGGGRGGASSAAVSKGATNTTGRGRGGARRGRAKNFTDSRVQAAYERQRDLKASYQAVAHALKPALQDLAERTVDELMKRPDAHKQFGDYTPVAAQLRSNLKRKLAECDSQLKLDLALALDTFNADQYVAQQEFKNGIDDMDEQFWEGQENRLRILAGLDARNLPVDVLDDQYEYKVISDKELDENFGIYECYQNGHLVPYPSRVRGTYMWKRNHKEDPSSSTASTTTTTAPTRGRGRGRGATYRRRGQDTLESQPTPKKSTRGMEDAQLSESSVAPAPAKGLLASAAEVEAHPEVAPADEDSVPASPEPINLFSGMSSAARAKAQAKLREREKSPPLPKNVADPDDFGFRIYNQKPSLKEKGINNRILAPRLFWFDEHDIGFRDSSNDSSKGHTRAKRGKYLDTPDSNGMHFDHWCNGYDYAAMKPEELDQEKVKRHNLHDKYGIFLSSSSNEDEHPDRYIMPGKPVLFIANPSGRVSHASRSFQKAANARRELDAPWRKRIGASMRRFCKLNEVDAEEVSIEDTLLSEDELRSRSLGTALRELESRPSKEDSADTEDQAESKAPELDADGRPILSVLSHAAAYIAAEDKARAPPPTPKQTRYDAIRDVFTSSKPAASPVRDALSIELNFLAELCDNEPRRPGDIGNSGVVPLVPGPALEEVRDPYQGLSPYSGPSYPPRPSSVLNRQPSHVQAQAPHPFQPVPSAQGHRGDYGPYQSVLDTNGSPRVSSITADYRAPMQDPGFNSRPGYPVIDAREPFPPNPNPRPYEPDYFQRRVSDFAAESPAYSRPYWSSQPPPGPAPPIGQSQQFLSQAPTISSRNPFSHNATAEPLPPLRPPRARTQSIQDDQPGDPSMRSASQSGFYAGPQPPSSGSSYRRAFSTSEPYGAVPPGSSERVLPNPQQPGHGPQPSQSYIGSPPPPLSNYAPQPLSPTFGNPQDTTPNPGQSPPGTPSGPPGSGSFHRSTPSGSSDAGNKYRKLQPAPVPAHRAWTNKPELKTIPYDHKETGSIAALPSSGPTQIRGWNVNQHRKRPRGTNPVKEFDRADPVNERDVSR